MVKHRLSPFLVFILFFALSGLAEGSQVSLSIRYHDMRIFYIDSNPIWVQITLTNNGPNPYRFRLADERAFSLDFDVRTTTNRPVEAADILVRRRTTSQQVFFRDILIEAGESFSFMENLRDYALLDSSGAFVVQARIYPELFRPELPVSAGNFTSDVLESNRLSLNVRPPHLIGPDGVPLALDVETNAVLVRERLPPDDVISYTLSARQRGQWERFFLYLDLESMLARDPYRRRQWLAESEEGRQRMVDRYRMELQDATIDADIATIPANFTIERTVYGPEEGTVTVMQFFRVGNFTERKRYTYYLRRRDNIWTIVDYSVVNMGTE